MQGEAVALLALVAGQDVEPGDGPGHWRITRRTAPDRVVSTLDPESRHVHKTRHAYRDGYKAHLAVEPDTGLITDIDLIAGNVGEPKPPPTSSTANPRARSCSATPPTAQASSEPTCRSGTCRP